MYTALQNVITDSGIWNGERRKTHGFLLSPSVFTISKDQQQELTHLGYTLFKCLQGLSYIAGMSLDTGGLYMGAWPLVRKVISSGVPKHYQELQGTYIKQLPRLLKVDFMLDQDGTFKIAEIDGHNKHGIGYSTLAKRFASISTPKSQMLPGVVPLLAKEIVRLGYGRIQLLYADQERFYLPEMEVTRQELAKHGIVCEVTSENEPFAKTGLFMDLPFLYQNTCLYESMIAGYKDGTVEFVIPPKPFLGSKGLLALLRNDAEDELLEGLLTTFIKPEELNLLRGYIPETYLVGKQGISEERVKVLTTRKRYVLKESISSGMKGTVFSDDSYFGSTLSHAYFSNMNWILQEEVANMPQSFSWFDDNGVLHSADNWFMRVTTHYVNRQLADVVVTARRDKAVHGAKDCIQIGTVIV